MILFSFPDAACRLLAAIKKNGSVPGLGYGASPKSGSSKSGLSCIADCWKGVNGKRPRSLSSTNGSQQYATHN